MRRFNMNGYEWRIIKVSPYSEVLIDRTGTLTVATTDPHNQTIYISFNLYGDFLTRVIIHELGHAAMFSYYLIDDIHAIVPKWNWVEAEEMAANFMADYGWKIFQVLRDLMFYRGDPQ